MLDGYATYPSSLSRMKKISQSILLHKSLHANPVQYILILYIRGKIAIYFTSRNTVSCEIKSQMLFYSSRDLSYCGVACLYAPLYS